MLFSAAPSSKSRGCASPAACRPDFRFGLSEIGAFSSLLCWFWGLECGKAAARKRLRLGRRRWAPKNQGVLGLPRVRAMKNPARFPGPSLGTLLKDIFLYDEITWSDELYRIFDLAPPLTLDRLRTRIHPEDISLYEKMVEQARCGGNDFEWQYRLQMPDHSVKYLHAVAHATQDEHGSLEYIAAVQDVTERRLSEEALAKARSELEQVTRITGLGVLTASIAHEVKQPLAAIVTNAESTLRWLGRDQPDIEKVRVFTKRVVADARRASEIVDRIRDMARQKTPEQTLLSFDDVVGDALSFLRPELQLRGIGVTLDLTRGLPQVVGDRTQLQQVIANLVINAVQAMIPTDPADRIISLSARSSDPGTVCCTIEDSGPGIDPVHLPHPFDNFFTTKDTGMGLGLAICRSIVEAHGGRICADNNSALGGARFSFNLHTLQAEQA